MAFRAPLLGYNTNVRHKGKLYHIQTEDSGVGHPHIMTHLFADGGRIVASRKTTYADHVGAENLQVLVKKLMQSQHKAMFIALRDGAYDDDATDSAHAEPSSAASEPSQSAPAPQQGMYQETQAASGVEAADPALPSKPPVSIFGSDLMSEKSLDEVILSYLASNDGDSRND